MLRWPLLRALQLLLRIACGEWLLTAAEPKPRCIVKQRPFLRLAAILGSVAVLARLAALLMQYRRVKATFAIAQTTIPSPTTPPDTPDVA